MSTREDQATKASASSDANARDLGAIVTRASLDQSAAANPHTSAWVAASAGTGKTRVLTNRFLRLLLLGEPPESLLALTFTKAAAAEMANRITDELEEWSRSDDTTLTKTLTKLVGKPPTVQEFQRARLLFTRSLSLPQGFSIQTIHSFCGSLLKRFPIEAGIAPDSRQVDEFGASALLTEVIEQLATSLDTDDPVRLALDDLLIRLTPEALTQLMAHSVGERARIDQALGTTRSVTDHIARLAAHFEVPAQWLDDPAAKQTLIDRIMNPEPTRRHDLEYLRGVFADDTGKSSQKYAAAISALIDGQIDFWDYKGALLNKDGTPPKRILKCIKTDALAEPLYLAELDRLTGALRQLDAIELLLLNRSYMTFALRVMDALSTAKRQRNILDFDDMILMAARLLESEGMAKWVQFKLDQGIRHLLVDEAQDTNPEQWRVIEALASEFFSGQGAENSKVLDRTLFVVGDLKQSIYGFQRADPELFKQGRNRFQAKAKTANRDWLDQPLTTTFRCAPAILEAVNATFTQGAMAQGLTFADDGTWDHHSSARAQASGAVILHPPLIKPRKQTTESWASLPGESIELDDQFDPVQELADEIAQQIAHWTAPQAIGKDDTSQWLSTPAGGARRVKPGDILILLRKRGPFADRLITALQNAGVPVAGADRLKLLDQIAIKDLLTLADASLQPADDLAVATMLRSPLACIDDAVLEDLAVARQDSGQTLLEALETLATSAATASSVPAPSMALTDALRFLTTCQRLAARLPAYEFFSRVLYAPLGLAATGQERLLARLGDDILDPLHELLAQARAFEQDAPATLQQFLVWIRSRDEKIKRDLDNSDGAEDDAGGDNDAEADGVALARTPTGQVRVMTAHASKGLEAPIVILGDAFQSSRDKYGARLIWTQPNGSAAALPIWSPSLDDDSVHTSVIKEGIKHSGEMENRRLLYVAMTRAEERLHVFGMRGETKNGENNRSAETSWYSAIENGLKSLVDPVETLVRPLAGGGEWRGSQYRLATGEPQIPDIAPALPIALDSAFIPAPKDGLNGQSVNLTPSGPRPTLPEWASKPPLAEPAPPRPLSPSHLDPDAEKSIVAPSPINSGIKQRFLRGNLIHSLFKLLPDHPAARWKDIAHRLLDKPAYALAPEQIDEIISQVLSVLENPKLAKLFGANSQAEVPLSGIVNTVPIAGQLDRLVEVKDPGDGTVREVLVIDYKTNRPPPSDLAGVERAYRLQMAAYARILEQIYPHAVIRPYLLWTDSLHLMELSDWRSEHIPSAKGASPRQPDLPL